MDHLSVLRRVKKSACSFLSTSDTSLMFLMMCFMKLLEATFLLFSSLVIIGVTFFPALLAAMVSALFFLLASLVAVAYFYLMASAGFNFSINFLFFKGFFFWMSWAITSFLAGLTTDWISLELMILARSPVDMQGLCNW